jgi:hypothetical protein
MYSCALDQTGLLEMKSCCNYTGTKTKFFMWIFYLYKGVHASYPTL